MSDAPPFQIPTLQTERLLVRELVATDDVAIFRIFSDPEVMRYWSRGPLEELSEAQALIADVRSGYETGGLIQLGIVPRDERVVAGTCTLHAFNWSCRRAEIGYALRRDMWGRGYAAEALRALLDYAFFRLHLNRLEADIDPRNEPSARVLERLGFVREGYLRQRWIVNGEVSDTALYGLLADEWPGRTT